MSSKKGTISIRNTPEPQPLIFSKHSFVFVVLFLSFKAAIIVCLLLVSQDAEETPYSVTSTRRRCEQKSAEVFGSRKAFGPDMAQHHRFREGVYGNDATFFGIMIKFNPKDDVFE